MQPAVANENNLPEVTINDMTHDGRGIGRHNGKTVFITGALIGEVVRFKRLKRRRKWDEGVAIDVLKTSPERVTPRCAHFLRCGGCTFQHASLAYQRDWKQETLYRELEHVGKVEPVLRQPPVIAEPWHYRRQARLGVRFVIKKEQVLVGFRETNSSRLAELKKCDILHPNVGNLLTDLQDLIGSLSIYDKIAQIEVTIDNSGVVDFNDPCKDKTVLIFRNLAPWSAKDLELLEIFHKKTSCLIYGQSKGPDTVKPLFPSEKASLQYTLKHEIFKKPLKLAFEPGHFVQVNDGINQQLVPLAMEWLALKPGEKALDFFCGLGNFTVGMASQGADVIGIEVSEAMVKQAEKNFALNGFENAKAVAWDLTKPLDMQTLGVAKIDAALIDPPRSGAEEVLPTIASLKPKRLVYVSCNPATLARDLGQLVHTHGFKLERVTMLDMFTHTGHVESMALLTSTK